MCPQSSQQQGNVAEASPRERDPIYWYFSVQDGTCIRTNTYFFPVMKCHSKLGKSCSTGINTQEEVDTIMILHAVLVAGKGIKVKWYSQNTDVLLLALC